MKFKRNWVWVLLLSVALATTGCGIFSTEGNGGNGEGPDLTTPGPVCTPPACAEGEILQCGSDNCPGGCGTICVLPNPVVDPGLGAAPADWDGLESWLVSAWNNQANPAAVRAGLRTSGWLEGYETWTGADLDGDLRDEWIIQLVNPDQSQTAPFGRPGNLWIVNGNGIVYRAFDTPEGNSAGNIAPSVMGLIDMTNDGRPDLVTEQANCGANTCWGNYQVVSTVRGTFENIVDVVPAFPDVPDDDLIAVSYPTASFSDFELDGRPELSIHGGSQGSVGAGIHQTYVEFWSWDGTAVTLKDRFYDSTEYRHHAVYDANRAMERGEYDLALSLYEGAVNNSNLITVSTLGGADDGGASVYAAISQFAAARLVQIDLLQGDVGRAASRASWLERTYPGTAVTNATVRLVTEWTGEEGNMAALCESIETELAEFDQPFGPLTDEMGYANPSLGAAEFCP